MIPLRTLRPIHPQQSVQRIRSPTYRPYRVEVPRQNIVNTRFTQRVVSNKNHFRPFIIRRYSTQNVVEKVVWDEFQEGMRDELVDSLRSLSASSPLAQQESQLQDLVSRVLSISAAKGREMAGKYEFSIAVPAVRLFYSLQWQIMLLPILFFKFPPALSLFISQRQNI